VKSRLTKKKGTKEWADKFPRHGEQGYASRRLGRPADSSIRQLSHPRRFGKSYGAPWGPGAQSAPAAATSLNKTHFLSLPLRTPTHQQDNDSSPKARTRLGDPSILHSCGFGSPEIAMNDNT
jgi:hypothetical protein